MSRSGERIDWSQLWYPGPTRRFSADELARAGNDAPSRTLLAAVYFNLALLAMVLLQAAPPQATALLAGLMVAAAASGLAVAGWLWRHPDRRRMNLLTLGYCIAWAAAGILLKARHADEALQLWAFGVCMGTALLASLGFWAVSLYRAQQIEGRLREIAERERAVELARQLAAAQIQPHFLFNSLASLQHWVHAGDARAAPLLDALAGFLRATLPLFDRERLTLGEELDAAERYLQVMVLRLGARLRFSIDAAEDARRVALPPGLLLTLVENAVEHGVQPLLGGGEVAMVAACAGGRLTLEVCDSGPGPDPGAPENIGLQNTRARLAQAFGQAAQLTLSARAGGGCCARLSIPLKHPPP